MKCSRPCNGEEALKTVAEEKPDLALLDVVLPGMDGIEVLRQTRKLSSRRRSW